MNKLSTGIPVHPFVIPAKAGTQSKKKTAAKRLCIFCCCAADATASNFAGLGSGFRRGDAF